MGSDSHELEFEEWFRRWMWQGVSYLRSRGLSESDAWDCVQIAGLRIYRAWPDIDKDQLPSFAGTVLRRVMIDHFRKEGKELGLEDLIDLGRSLPDDFSAAVDALEAACEQSSDPESLHPGCALFVEAVREAGGEVTDAVKRRYPNHKELKKQAHKFLEDYLRRVRGWQTRFGKKELGEIFDQASEDGPRLDAITLDDVIDCVKRACADHRKRGEVWHALLRIARNVVAGALEELFRIQGSGKLTDDELFREVGWEGDSQQARRQRDALRDAVRRCLKEKGYGGEEKTDE